MKRLLIVLTVLSMSACSTFAQKPKKAQQIQIAEEVRLGKCEEEIQELQGTTSRALIEHSLSLIGKVHNCRLEKQYLVNLIESYNKEVNK
jgi:hypothetical protein|nr:MAG TPA: TraF protein [Bacteriophage sp.]